MAEPITPADLAQQVWDQREVILLILSFVNYLQTQNIYLMHPDGTAADVRRLLIGYFGITPIQWEQINEYLAREQQ